MICIHYQILLSDKIGEGELDEIFGILDKDKKYKILVRLYEGTSLWKTQM
jgi:hypothetical protein